jgi:GTPase Era involved in 16S rRNA processing
LEETFKLTDIKNQRTDWLKKELQKSITQTISEIDLQVFVTKLYEKAYNALDLIQLIEDGQIDLTIEKRYELLIAFNKVRKEFRNEKLLLMFILNFVFIDKETKLENISFM